MKDVSLYTQEGLSNIKQSNFLSEGDLNFIIDHKKNFQDLFEKKKIWRSRVDMEVSVLNDVKFPDNASKYWQCVRECDAFYNYLVELSFDFRRNQVKRKGLLRSLENNIDELEKELLQIDLEELEYIITNQIQQAKHRVREIKEWVDLMAKYDDGSFDSNNIESSQLLSYAQSFIKKYMATEDTMEGSEKINITGLLVTSLRRCEELNLTNQLLESLSEEEIDFLNKINNKKND